MSCAKPWLSEASQLFPFEPPKHPHAVPMDRRCGSCSPVPRAPGAAACPRPGLVLAALEVSAAAARAGAAPIVLQSVLLLQASRAAMVLQSEWRPKSCRCHLS